MNAVKMVEPKYLSLFLFQMRDGGSVAVSLRTVGYVTVSVCHLKSVEDARCKNQTRNNKLLDG